MPTHSCREKPQCPAHRLVDRLLDQLHHDVLRFLQRRIMLSRVRGVRRIDPVQVFEVIAHFCGDFNAVALVRAHGQHGVSAYPQLVRAPTANAGGRM